MDHFRRSYRHLFLPCARIQTHVIQQFAVNSHFGHTEYMEHEYSYFIHF